MGLSDIQWIIIELQHLIHLWAVDGQCDGRIWVKWTHVICYVVIISIIVMMKMQIDVHQTSLGKEHSECNMLN